MLNIGNLTTSQFIRKNIYNHIKEITESTERLSSGKRVNNASDDPGIIGTISRLNTQVSSISQGLLNGGQAKVLAQTAESGLKVINNLLSRIRELEFRVQDQLLQRLIGQPFRLKWMPTWLK